MLIAARAVCFTTLNGSSYVGIRRSTAGHSSGSSGRGTGVLRNGHSVCIYPRKRTRNAYASASRSMHMKKPSSQFHAEPGSRKNFVVVAALQNPYRNGEDPDTNIRLRGNR